MKKAFTIIELLVAMALLSMLIAISGLVFSTAVKAHRVAIATAEISAKLQTFTQQLDADFGNGHLQKDGEFYLIFMPSEQVNRDGSVLDVDNNNRPDQYISFDRLSFFVIEDGQAFQEQPTQTPGVTTPVSSNMARISYIFGKNAASQLTSDYPEGEKRLFCRTQHLITADMNLKPFPDTSGTWDSNQFYLDNFLNYQYQTVTMEDWWNLPAGMKNDILTEILDVSFTTNTIPERGPEIDTTQSTTLHNLFMQGIGQFHVMVWRSDLGRWYPEYDPDGDGNYGDSDYPTITKNGQQIIETPRSVYPSDLNVTAFSNLQGDTANYSYSRVIGSNRVFTPMPFTKAFKFIFTLYDSNGVFKDGKTFTYIVNLQ